MSETVTLSKGTAVDGKGFDVHSTDETRSVEDPVTSKISLKQAFEVKGRVDAQRQLQTCAYTSVALPKDSHECPKGGSAQDECGSAHPDCNEVNCGELCEAVPQSRRVACPRAPSSRRTDGTNVASMAPVGRKY